MDRRAFFRLGSRKVARVAVEQLDRKARQRAARWIRPPYALDELEFLLACTRCGDCIEACPEGILFRLPARLGAEVAGTPALNLVSGVCRLCQDWPCVAACRPGALRRDEVAPGRKDAPPRPPQLSRVVIDTRRCLPYSGPECGACAHACPVEGALGWEGPRPVIDAGRCVGCAACRAACVVEPAAIEVRSLYREGTDALPV